MSEWTDKEEHILEKKYPRYSSTEIANNFLDRSPSAVKRKAKRLNISSKPDSSKLDCILCGREYNYKPSQGRSKKYCLDCNKRRKNIAYKQAVVSISGGECHECGYSDCYSALTFHHIGEKNFNFSELTNQSYSHIAEELQNVYLLCENCHNEEHCEGSRGYCPKHNWENRCCTEDDQCDRSCHTMYVRHRRRLRFLKQKGGKCEECNYSGCTGSVTFHHRNPNEKEISLNVTAFSRSIESLEEEVAKCDLLCHNCHQKHHCECEVKCSDMFEDYAERAEEQIRSYL